MNNSWTHRRLAMAIAMILGGCPAAQAAVITVNSNADDGTDCTLREAIQNANQNTDGGGAGNGCAAGAPGEDEIVFAPHLGPIVLQNGQLTVTESLTITGPPGRQVISGDQQSRVIGVTESTAFLTLRNLRVEHGYTNLFGSTADCTAGDGNGAGVCSLGAVDMDNSLVRDNHAQATPVSGGGMAVAGDLAISNSTISGNTALANELFAQGLGGGIYVSGNLSVEESHVLDNRVLTRDGGGGGIAVMGDSEINDSEIAGNTMTINLGPQDFLFSSDLQGGGLRAEGTVQLRSSIVSDNGVLDVRDREPRGGGVYVNTNDGALTVENSLIEGNNLVVTSSGGSGFFTAGGGIYAATDSVIIKNSTINNNPSRGRGGGAFISAMTSAVIENSRFTNNALRDGFGGGLAVFGGDVSVSNSVISGNNTSGVLRDGNNDTQAGAAGLYANTDKLTITGSTIAENVARIDRTALPSFPYGGAGMALQASELLVENTTISGNTGGNAAAAMIAAGDGKILNSTFVGNSDFADEGPSPHAIEIRLSDHGNFEFSNNVLSGNLTDRNLSFVLSDGATVTANANIAERMEDFDGTTGSGNIIAGDPGLRVLADNGCTQPAGRNKIDAACPKTHALFADSVALDAADGSIALLSDGDQRGADFPRLIGPQRDIGAFEGVIQGGDFPVLPRIACAQFQQLLLRQSDGVLARALAADGTLRAMRPIDEQWAVLGAEDFSGDGRKDLLLQHIGTGQLVTYAAFACVPQPLFFMPQGWRVVGIGDFDGDGLAEVVIRQQSTGTLLRVTVDESGPNYEFILNLWPAWKVVGVGDANGDVNEDLFLRHQQTGEIALFFMNGADFTLGYVGEVDLAWQVKGVDDLGADGRADIVFRHEDGQLFMFEMDGRFFTPRSIGGLSNDWKVIGLADLDDDNRADIVLRNRATGLVVQWRMNNNQATPIRIGDVPQEFIFSVPRQALDD